MYFVTWCIKKRMEDCRNFPKKQLRKTIYKCFFFLFLARERMLTFQILLPMVLWCEQLSNAERRRLMFHWLRRVHQRIELIVLLHLHANKICHYVSLTSVSDICTFGYFLAWNSYHGSMQCTASSPLYMISNLLRLIIGIFQME